MNTNNITNDEDSRKGHYQLIAQNVYDNTKSILKWALLIAAIGTIIYLIWWFFQNE